MLSNKKDKKELVEELVRIFSEYKVISLAGLYRIGASQLNEIRRKLGDKVLFRVEKSSLVKKAIERSGKPNIGKLADHIKGSNILLCTDVNPFKLIFLLKKSAISVKARAGDIAQEDIVVLGGNTGLPPGPVISELDAAGIPTRIESGSIWITRDTLVVKKGDVIPEQVARALSRMDIRPIKVTLTPFVAYDDGMIFASDVLTIDERKYFEDIQMATRSAVALGVEAFYPAVETIRPIIREAHNVARRIGLNVAYPSLQTLPELLKTAHGTALALGSRFQELSGK